MRLTTVAVAALLVCASFAPAAMALGDPAAERHGPTDSVTVADRAVAALQTGETTTTSQSNQSNATSSSDAALGLRVSSFVQSTSSETAGVVDSGMWAADVTRSNRPEAVDQRVTDLREQLSTLRSERAELREAYQAGEISRLQYRSQLAELNGRFAALSTATKDTERAATQLNTQAPGLQQVREDLDAERRAGGFGLGRPATVGLMDASDGNESTTGDPEPRRGNGDGPSGDGDDNPGNGNGAGADSVSAVVADDVETVSAV